MTHDLPTYRSKLVIVEPDARGPGVYKLQRDMQLERSHILGVRFIVQEQVQKSPIPSERATVVTMAQVPLLKVQFYDRYHEVVWDEGPVRPFVMIGNQQRELFRPVSWRGTNLQDSRIFLDDPNGETSFLIFLWEFLFIEGRDVVA